MLRLAGSKACIRGQRAREHSCMRISRSLQASQLARADSPCGLLVMGVMSVPCPVLCRLKPPEKSALPNGRVRRRIYSLVLGNAFEVFILMVIVINAGFLAATWYQQPSEWTWQQDQVRRGVAWLQRTTRQPAAHHITHHTLVHVRMCTHTHAHTGFACP